MVVGFVPVAQSLEDFHGFRHSRRIDNDRLEAAGQSLVLLDVFAELIEGRRPDALNFTTCQGGFEHIRGVDGAFSSTRTDQRVQFVDEQNDVLGPAHFIHDGLDAFLELAAILGSCNHHRQVQHDNPLVTEQFRHVTIDDHLGQTLDDRGFPYACFAQKHGIVFLTPRQNLDDALNLVGATDDGIELALASQLGQVTTEAIQSRGF